MNKITVVFLTLCMAACVTPDDPYGATREAAALRKGGALPVPRSFLAVRAAFDPSGKHHVMQKWMTVDYEDVIDGSVHHFGYLKSNYIEMISPHDGMRRRNWDTRWIKYFVFPLPLNKEGRLFRYLFVFKFERFFFDGEGLILSGWFTKGIMEMYTAEGIRLGTVLLQEDIYGKRDSRISFFYFRGDREASKPAYCSIKFEKDTYLPDDEHPIVLIKKGTNIRLEEDWE